jgi:hypothetical protein
MSAATVRAKDVIASLKSGVLLKGFVRSHTTDRATNLAWIAIDLPVIGERLVPIKDEQNLPSGQQIAIECVPNPLHAERYIFRMVEVLRPEPSEPGSASLQRLRYRSQVRRLWQLHRRREWNVAG